MGNLIKKVVINPDGSGGGDVAGVSSFNTRTGAVASISGDYNASQISYDNATSGYLATNTQDAIDEIANGLGITILDGVYLDFNNVAWETLQTGNYLIDAMGSELLNAPFPIESETNQYFIGVEVVQGSPDGTNHFGNRLTVEIVGVASPYTLCYVRGGRTISTAFWSKLDEQLPPQTVVNTSATAFNLSANSEGILPICNTNVASGDHFTYILANSVIKVKQVNISYNAILRLNVSEIVGGVSTTIGLQVFQSDTLTGTYMPLGGAIRVFVAENGAVDGINAYIKPTKPFLRVLARELGGRNLSFVTTNFTIFDNVVQVPAFNLTLKRI